MRRHFLTLLIAMVATTMSLKAQTILIDEGFENGIQDSVWTQEFVVGHQEWKVESLEDGLSYPANVWQGTKRAYLRNTTGETQGYVTRLISKTMDLRPDKVYQPELTFWYANPKWTADRDTLRVLYRTGPKAKWQQLAEFGTASANWQKVYLELPEVNETYQIAFEGTDNLGHGIVLDSIKLRSAPQCVIPHDISITHQGNGKVFIGWNASWDASSYDLIITKDVKINPDTINNVADSVIAVRESIEGLFQNYTAQLESGAYYYVYLRSICDKEASMWNSEDPEQSGDFRFRVKATKNIPYNYGFDMPYEAGVVRRDLEWTWGGNTGHFNPFINVNTPLDERSRYSKDATTCVIFTGQNNLTSAVPASKYAYVATPALADKENPNFALSQCQVRFWTTVYQNTHRDYARSLIVGVMTDPEDITTFVAIDTVSVWGTSTFVENIVDLSSYTGDGMYVAFMSNFDQKNIIYLDDVTIEYKTNATKVTNIRVNPRDTWADITWESNAPTYNLMITNADVDPTKATAEQIVEQTTVTGNSYKTEALEADHSWNRPYYVHVQAVNGENKSEWSYRYPFVTIAAQKSVPYTFDFEQASGIYNIGDDPRMYPTNIGIFSNDPEYPYTTVSNAHEGSNCLFLTKDWGNDSWITLPPVDSLSDKEVQFYLSGSSTPTQAYATVGVMTNPMDFSTFVPVSECKLASTGYTRCYANFLNYKGPDGVIAIAWSDVDGGKQTINYIDDVVVQEMSKCIPPVNIVTDATSDSVTISWAASDASMWQFIFATKALTANQLEKLTFDSLSHLEGILFADTLTWDQASDPTFGFDSLNYNTPYYIYVRTLCGEETAWWVSNSFKTPCPDDFPIPFFEDFEGVATGDYSGGFKCWQFAQYGTGTGYPKILNLTTGEPNGNMLELWSTSTTQRNLAMLPGLDADMKKVVLSFKTRSWSATAKSVIYVGSMSDITDWTTFVPVDTFYNENGNLTQVRMNLEDYNFAYNNIVFTSGLGDNLEMASDVMIDDISIKPNTCIEAWNFEATDIQTNSIDIKWQGKADNDEWVVKVMSDTVVLVADSTITGKAFHIGNLTAMTAYTFSVKPSCDTIWASATYRTSCVKLDPTKPNKEDFESITDATTSYKATSQIQCWTASNGNPGTGTSYLPYVYKSTTYSSSGNNTYRMYGTTTYYPAYVVTPEIDIENMKDLAVTFNMYATTSYWWICGVMSDPEDLSTFVVLDSVKGTGKSVQYTYDLSEYADSIPATAKYFAWRGRYGATDYSYLDDVSIIKMNCPLPKPSYSGLTAEQVRISAGLRTDNDWILLAVDTAAFTADQLALLNVDSLVNNDSLWQAHVVFYDTIDVKNKVITGLTEQTDYYVAVAASCEDGLSQWQVITFKTPCKAVKPEEMGTITFSAEEGYVSGSSATRYLPCWTVGNKSGNVTSVTSTYYPYINTTASYMHNGNKFLNIYSYVSSSASYDGAYAIMPELDVEDISKYQVNFWARTNSSTTAAYHDNLIIGVVTDPSDLNTFAVVDTLKLSHTVHEPFTVSFEDYQGDFQGNMGRYIMFMTETGVTGATAYGYAYISEISVEKIPTCRPVTEFTVDSIAEDAAKISWKQYSDSYRMLVADKEVAEKDK
ncbi:MAG: hypothetical protein J5884_01805, partial [Paludibacteraceae bacterium]|nr:hypothetical protein [Paludibacteraceae bacterium]